VTAGAGEEGDGERILHAPSCEELAGAAALIVALGFDPAAVAAQAERAALSPPSPATAADRAPTPPAKRAAAPPRPQPPPATPRAAPPPARTESTTPVRPGVWLGAGTDLGSFAAPEPNMPATEAEWTEAGARCVRDSRSFLIPADGCTFEIPKKLCGNPPHWDHTLLVSQMPN
jgi:hypothetical protein